MNQESWGRVYRAVRVTKGFFDRALIVRLSLLEAHSVYYFLQRMLAKGYIVEAGRDGRKIIYQGTTLLRNTPITPPAPRKERRRKRGAGRCKPDDRQGVTGELTRLNGLLGEAAKEFKPRLNGLLRKAAKTLKATGDLPAVPSEIMAPSGRPGFETVSRKEGAQWLN